MRSLPGPIDACTFSVPQLHRPTYAAEKASYVRLFEPCRAYEDRVVKAALTARKGALLQLPPAQRHTAPRVLMFDTFPWYPKEGEKELAHFKDGRLSWAKLSAEDHIHRPGVDVSLAPPAHNALQFYRFQPLPGVVGTGQPTKALLCFIGNFAAHPVRTELAQLHNESQGVIVKNSGYLQPGARNYAELMATCKFAAAPRGDALFSYRFTEAVCSGAVPVLIADGWVPPLNSTMPLSSYGVHVAESEVSTLVPRLEAISAEEHARMRANALQFCHRHIATVHQSLDATLSEAMSTL